MADDATFHDQFATPSVLMFVGVEVELPDGGWLRLIDGSGSVSFSGKTFVGQDAGFGVLASLGTITDGFGDAAPSLKVGINPPTSDAAAILCGQDMQGQQVLVWLGAVDPASGAVTGTPLLIYSGESDQGVLSVGFGSRAVALNTVSIWERLFDDAEGVRLTNAYHQSAWPGELGMQFITDIQRSLPWGQDAARPSVTVDALYVRPNVAAASNRA
jgi:hypothetical protein